MDVGWKSFEASDSKNLDCLEEIVDGNMNVKGNSGSKKKSKNKKLKVIVVKPQKEGRRA